MVHGGRGGGRGMISPGKTSQRANSLRSEAERFANQMATEVSSTSQRLKGPEVPNTGPTAPDPQCACRGRLRCTAHTPKHRQGNASPRSFETKFSHEILPRPVSPSLCRGVVHRPLLKDPRRGGGGGQPRPTPPPTHITSEKCCSGQK